MRKPLLFVAFGVLLAACATDHGSDGHAAASSAAATGALDLTADAGGKTVPLHVGQQRVVRLAANPTTGYQWQLGGLDQKVVRVAGEPEYVPDPNSGNLAGAGGNTVFHFTAIAPGTTTLELDYIRPWEQGIPPAGKFTVTFAVSA